MVPVRAALALAAACGWAAPVGAATATYHCLPINVTESSAALIVSCAEPSPLEGGYPWDGAARISRFGVDKNDATGFAARFLDLAQTALVAGAVLRVQYTAGQTSKNPPGCEAHDCRRPTIFGLLAPDPAVRIPYARWPGNKNTTIAAGEWQHYGPFSISTIRRLVVKLTGSGNADLYLQRDQPVTPDGHVCRPAKPDSNETCQRVVDPPDQGATFYVAVKGVAASSTYKLSVAIQLR